MENSKEILSEQEFCRYIGIKPKTAQAYRQNGYGPKYVRISRRCIRYRKEDVDAWMKGKLTSSTSEIR